MWWKDRPFQERYRAGPELWTVLQVPPAKMDDLMGNGPFQVRSVWILVGP
jgi:hypothetical protein